METKRCFIALELNEAVRRRIDWVIQYLKAYDLPSIRWVPVKNMHLTIKFLGEVEEGNIPKISQSLERIGAQTPPFYMVATGLGLFPAPRNPRIVWAGVNAPDVINTLQKMIEQETRRQGYPVESRPYHPHFTLGRVDESVSTQEIGRVVRAVNEIDASDLGTVLCNNVQLFHSDLRPSGPIYTSLFSAPLKGIVSGN